MNRLLMLLSLKPILYGLIGMLVSGTVFPICGVIIVRNNLMPMRYMLMHGVILGGILSVSLSLPLLPITIFLNILLVLIMVKMGKGKDGSIPLFPYIGSPCKRYIGSIMGKSLCLDALGPLYSFLPCCGHATVYNSLFQTLIYDFLR